MKFGNLENVDPHLTKLRVSDGGGKRVPPRAASKAVSQTDGSDDMISRSKQRREYLQSSYDELLKCQHQRQLHRAADEVHHKSRSDKDNSSEVQMEEYRGSSYRTRKLWDFDLKVTEETDTSLLSPRPAVATDSGKALWTASDIRRELRQTVTHQVRQDLIEMEHFSEGMRRRIAHYNPVLKKEDGTRVVLDEKRDDSERGNSKENAAGIELRLTFSNEEKETRKITDVVDDGYGKVVATSKASASRVARQSSYCGMNEEYQSRALKAEDKSEEYFSTTTSGIDSYASPRAVRLQRIRELNKQNHQDRTTRRSSQEDIGVDTALTTRNHTMDEIMPPSPRYYRIIRERNALLTDVESTASPVIDTYYQSSSSKPPFSPPVKSIKSRTGYSQSLSPPKRQLTFSRRQLLTPPSNQRHSTKNVQSPNIVATEPDTDAISIKSALSDDNLTATPSQRSSSTSSKSQSVAQTTLSVILERIEDAKENFQKALTDENVEKLAELASLIARLGEAAVAMKKLEDL
ncbi:hypothetical protein HJC23_011708 [Cyclotella cryptica]|uniref:Uncharacterized protein n=1 Tax=Cyclotella cryptica TaxID=29204 RepID=A0ABD3QM20_9STRA|eukprot:CCRYP_004826-RA/>CCRYP_004826-RA protein AED:0.00 eAED:0.00 QI:268/-1/1/1/-1/1/1/76/518